MYLIISLFLEELWDYLTFLPKSSLTIVGPADPNINLMSICVKLIKYMYEIDLFDFFRKQKGFKTLTSPGWR